MKPASHPSAEPPYHPADLACVDQVVVDGIILEHRRSVDHLGSTLLSAGWRPEQIEHALVHWSAAQIARAVAHERVQRGQPPVDPIVLAEVERAQPGARLAREEAAWEAAHGPTPPPRPPGSSVQIPLPPRPPAPRPPMPAHLRSPLPDPDAAEESQGERL